LNIEPLPFIRRMGVTLSVVIASVACDQVTKEMAIKELRGEPMRSYLGDTFRLQFAENRGAFLSLGASLSEEHRTILFSVLVGIFLVAMLIYTLVGKSLAFWHVMALALLVGGGLSNWWDRVSRDGRVVDFMNMGIGSLRTGIFNVADLGIMAGAFMMLVLGWYEKKAVPPSSAVPPPG